MALDDPRANESIVFDTLMTSWDAGRSWCVLFVNAGEPIMEVKMQMTHRRAGLDSPFTDPMTRRLIREGIAQIGNQLCKLDQERERAAAEHGERTEP